MPNSENLKLVPQTLNNCEISIEDKLLIARRDIAKLAGRVKMSQRRKR